MTTTMTQLYHSEDDKENPVAVYRRGCRLIKSRKASLELCDGYEGILDLIVGMGSEPSKPMM